MRLVCPNCDAEYEVDASVIPESGRDVQCSNCGHAWFQLSPEVESELAAEEALYEAPPAPPMAAAAEMAIPDGGEPHVEIEPARRNIDESVLSVLREEAERETEARKSDAPAVETQAELGLQPPSGGIGGAVARRLARLKGVEPEPVKPATRGEMFPEIDEINSTLRASTERRSGDAAAVAETMATDRAKPSGFRSGFSLMLLIAVLLVAAYAMAPKLAQQIPAAAGALNAFVAIVDAARLALDGLLKSAIGFLHGLAGGQS